MKRTWTIIGVADVPQSFAQAASRSQYRRCRANREPIVPSRKNGYPKNNQYGLDGCHFSLARDDQRGRRARGAADATFNTVRK